LHRSSDQVYSGMEMASVICPCVIFGITGAGERARSRLRQILLYCQVRLL